MSAANLALIMKVLDLILLGVTVAPRVAAEMEALKGRLAQMVAEGREPTAQEWDTLNAEIDDKIARLRGG